MKFVIERDRQKDRYRMRQSRIRTERHRLIQTYTDRQRTETNTDRETEIDWDSEVHTERHILIDRHILTDREQRQTQTENRGQIK